jgi:GNAT superfamily N-acetyltransferase
MAPDTLASARSRPRAVPVRLTAADVGELLTLQRAGYVTEGQKYDTVWLPPLTQTARELAEELDDPRVVGVGLREQGRLVAAVRLRHRNEGEVELRRLVVAPDRQGDGLGSTLLRVAEAILAPGTRRLVLFTGARSADNLRLYRRHGYLETHRSAAGGHELVHLAKPVAPEPQVPAAPDPAGIRAGVLASNRAADQQARVQARRLAAARYVAGQAGSVRYGVGSGPVGRVPVLRG